MNEISISIVLAPFCLPCVFMLTIFNHGLLSYFFLFNSPICMHLYILSCNTPSFLISALYCQFLSPYLFSVWYLLEHPWPLFFCISISTNCCKAHSKIAKESTIPKEQQAGICESPGRTGKQALHCGPSSPLKSTCWWKIFFYITACSQESQIIPLVGSALKTSKIR